MFHQGYSEVPSPHVGPTGIGAGREPWRAGGGADRLLEVPSLKNCLRQIGRAFRPARDAGGAGPAAARVRTGEWSHAMVHSPLPIFGTADGSHAQTTDRDKLSNCENRPAGEDTSSWAGTSVPAIGNAIRKGILEKAI